MRRNRGDGEKIVDALTAATKSLTISPDPMPLTTLAAPPAPTIAKPMTTPTTNQHVDIGIIIALSEEFNELHKLAGPFTPDKDGNGLISYRFTHGTYSIAAAFSGNMGESEATLLTDRLIERWKPEGIVVIGIAASVHEDLRVGDIFVPEQAVQYMQNAKASPKTIAKPTAATMTAKKAFKPAEEADEFVMIPGAPAYRASTVFLDSVRNLKFQNQGEYDRFQRECAADFRELIRDEQLRARMVARELVREELALVANGHVATGPVVGSSSAFSHWIQSHDRNVKALEMESAAVFLAAQARPTPKYRPAEIRCPFVGLSGHCQLCCG